MMDTREPLEWHFKQLDHAMGLSFKANFNFALVGHLLKGIIVISLQEDVYEVRNMRKVNDLLSYSRIIAWQTVTELLYALIYKENVIIY